MLTNFRLITTRQPDKIDRLITARQEEMRNQTAAELVSWGLAYMQASEEMRPLIAAEMDACRTRPIDDELDNAFTGGAIDICFN